MKKNLIAPCGMNCGICMAYLREKNTCPGCRIEDENKAISCKNCIIINCKDLNNNNSGFCFECPKVPCKRLKNLDKRYRLKYHMSMLENLNFIKEKGIEEFLKKEKQKWKCPKCNGIISCHRGYCFSCGFVKYKIMKK